MNVASTARSATRRATGFGRPDRRPTRGIRGSAAVEFAIVVPVLLVLVLGMIDYGWVFFVRLTMTNAAREGARVGATAEEAGDASADAQVAANQFLEAAGITATATATTPSAGSPEVQVTVSTGAFQPLVGFVPTPPSMTVVATMRWEMAP